MAHTEIWCESVGCIYLAQDRIHWQILVNMAINLCRPWSEDVIHIDPPPLLYIAPQNVHCM